MSPAASPLRLAYFTLSAFPFLRTVRPTRTTDHASVATERKVGEKERHHPERAGAAARRRARRSALASREEERLGVVDVGARRRRMERGIDTPSCRDAVVVLTADLDELVARARG